VEFRDVIRSEEELRSLMGDPVAPLVVEKTLSTLDPIARFRNLFQSPRVGLIFLVPGKRARGYATPTIL
jgi:hypothetical protein